MTPKSLRAFAKRMRCNESTVRRGIQTGRLERSVGVDAAGRPYIRDAALAAREWEENRAR